MLKYLGFFLEWKKTLNCKKKKRLRKEKEKLVEKP